MSETQHYESVSTGVDVAAVQGGREEQSVSKKGGLKKDRLTMDMLLKLYPHNTEINSTTNVKIVLGQVSHMDHPALPNQGILFTAGQLAKFYFMEIMQKLLCEEVNTGRKVSVTIVIYNHHVIKATSYLLDNLADLMHSLYENDTDNVVNSLEWDTFVNEKAIGSLEKVDVLRSFHDDFLENLTNPEFKNFVVNCSKLESFVSPFSQDEEPEITEPKKGKGKRKKKNSDDEEDMDYNTEEEVEDDDEEDEMDVERTALKQKIKEFDSVVATLNQMVSLLQSYLPHYVCNFLFSFKNESLSSLMMNFNKNKKKVVLWLPCKVSLVYMDTVIQLLCAIRTLFQSFHKYSEEILDASFIDEYFVNAILYKLKESIVDSKGSFTDIMEKESTSVFQMKDLYTSLSNGLQQVRDKLSDLGNFTGNFKVEKQSSESEKSDKDSENDSGKEVDGCTEDNVDLEFLEGVRSYAEQLKFIQPSRRLKISDISIRDLQRAYACMDALLSNGLIKDPSAAYGVRQSQQNISAILKSGNDLLPDELELKSKVILKHSRQNIRKKSEQRSGDKISEGDPPADPADPTDPADPASSQPAVSSARKLRAMKEIDQSQILEDKRQRNTVERLTSTQLVPDPKPRAARETCPDPFAEVRKKGDEIPGMDKLGQDGKKVVVVTATPSAKGLQELKHSNFRFSKPAEVGVYEVIRKSKDNEDFYEVSHKSEPATEKDVLIVHKDAMYQIMPDEAAKNIVFDEKHKEYDASKLDEHLVNLFNIQALYQKSGGKTYILGTHKEIPNGETIKKVSMLLGQFPDLEKKEKCQSSKRKRSEHPTSQPLSREQRAINRANAPEAGNIAKKRRLMKRTVPGGEDGHASSESEDSSDQRAARHTRKRGEASISKGKEEYEDDHGDTVYSKHPFQDEPIEFFDKAALREAGLCQVQDIAARSAPGKHRPRPKNPEEGSGSQDGDSSEDESYPSDDEGSDYDPNDENDETQGVFRAVVSGDQRQTRSRADHDPFTDEINKQYYPYNPTTPCVLFFEVTGEKESKRVRVFLFPRKMRLTVSQFSKIGQLLAGTGCWESDAPFLQLNIKYNTDSHLDPSERSIALCDITLIDPKEVAKEFWVLESDGSFRQNLWELIDRYVYQELECASWSLFTLFVLCPYDKNTWRHGVNERCMCKAGKTYRDCLRSNHSANQYCPFRPEILTGRPPCDQDKAMGRRMKILTPPEAQGFARAEPCLVDYGQDDCEVVQARYVGTYPSRDLVSSDAIERPVTPTAVALPSQPETQDTAAQEQVTPRRSTRATAPPEAEPVVTRRSTRGQGAAAPKKT